MQQNSTASVQTREKEWPYGQHKNSKKQFMPTLCVLCMNPLLPSGNTAEQPGPSRRGPVEGRVQEHQRNLAMDGCGRACAPGGGTLERKAGKRLRERSSASPLCKLGICLAVSLNWKDASRKNKQRRRCNRLLSRHDLAALTWTAASLSHQQRTLHPHAAQARRTATSSKKSMWKICA